MFILYTAYAGSFGLRIHTYQTRTPHKRGFLMVSYMSRFLSTSLLTINPTIIALRAAIRIVCKARSKICWILYRQALA